MLFLNYIFILAWFGFYLFDTDYFRSYVAIEGSVLSRKRLFSNDLFCYVVRQIVPEMLNISFFCMYCRRKKLLMSHGHKQPPPFWTFRIRKTSPIIPMEMLCFVFLVDNSITLHANHETNSEFELLGWVKCWTFSISVNTTVEHITAGLLGGD